MHELHLDYRRITDCDRIDGIAIQWMCAVPPFGGWGWTGVFDGPVFVWLLYRHRVLVCLHDFLVFP